MAYAQSHGSSERYVSLAVVAALHVAGIAALIYGLTVTFVPHADQPLTGEQIRLPEITPAPVPPTAKASAHPRTDANTRSFTLPTRNDPVIPDTFVIPDMGGGLGDDMGLDIKPSPLPSHLPSPGASFAPHGAAPHGNPGAWVSTSDYPSRALREERSGTTRFRLAISAEGAVTGCSIVQSSGSPELDAATCAKVSQRAKFTPATDENGARIAGTYASAVRWEIPR